MELREVGPDAVRQHQALEAAVVGLAHRGVHAHLGGDAADEQAVDPVVAQDQLEVRRVEGALAGLVEDHLAGRGRDRVDDVVALLPADEDAALRALGCRCRARARRGRAWTAGSRLRSARWPSRVWTTSMPAARAAASTARVGSTTRSSRPTSLPSSSPKPPGSRKSRCRSMMSSAVRGRREGERVRLGRDAGDGARGHRPLASGGCIQAPSTESPVARRYLRRRCQRTPSRQSRISARDLSTCGPRRGGPARPRLARHAHSVVCRHGDRARCAAARPHARRRRPRGARSSPISPPAAPATPARRSTRRTCAGRCAPRCASRCDRGLPRLRRGARAGRRRRGRRSSPTTTPAASGR